MMNETPDGKRAVAAISASKYVASISNDAPGSDALLPNIARKSLPR
jgi:hypothetical protein